MPPVLLPALACLAFASSPAAQGIEGSLESFLRRVRAERDAERQRLSPLVEELVVKLGQLRVAGEIKKLHDDLTALGSEAAPLLVPYLDPGPSPKPEQERQAQEVALWLARARPAGLLDDVVRMAHGGSPLGRRLALRLLADSPETERARAALRALYPASGGPLRAECVRALARFGNDEPLLVAALGDTHPEVLAAALEALVDEPRKKPRAEVMALLGDPSRGADVLQELVDYFCFPGQELDEEAVWALLGFARREDLPPAARLEVLDGLPRFGLSLSNRLRREIEPLLSSSDSAIRDAALIALTLLKDGRARRDLMRFYDEQVRENET